MLTYDRADDDEVLGEVYPLEDELERDGVVVLLSHTVRHVELYCHTRKVVVERHCRGEQEHQTWGRVIVRALLLCLTSFLGTVLFAIVD